MDNSIYESISKELNIPLEVVKEAYTSYWKFIRKTVEVIPLKDNLSEEDFSKLKTNFNIPSLGKLNCTYDRYTGINKKFRYIRELKNGNSKK